MKGVKLLSAAAVILAVASVAVTVILAQEKSEEQTIDDTVKSVLYKEAQCDKGKFKVINGLPVLIPVRHRQRYGQAIRNYTEEVACGTCLCRETTICG